MGRLIINSKQEFTVIKCEGIKQNTTLGDVSFMIGEAITELLDRGARNFQVKFDKDSIEIKCEKGFDGEEFVNQNGYDAERKYKNIW